MYDALTTTYRLSCPRHGETGMKRNEFAQAPPCRGIGEQQHQADNRRDQRDLRRGQVDREQLDQRVGAGEDRKGDERDAGGTGVGAGGIGYAKVDGTASGH